MIDVPALLRALGIEARLRGREWWAPCPQHDDKDPSWSIADAPGAEHHGYHYCWGCGWSGGPIVLVADVVGISNASAKRWIEERGLESKDAPPLNVALVVSPRATMRAFRLPLGLYGGPLHDWPTPARRYTESRGITAEQVVRWGLMYAVEGRLAGRIVIPIADERGVLRSYTARTFSGDATRFLNPESNEGADRSAVFGAQHWPLGGGRDRVIVTEAEIDALACERAGAQYVGALGGSKPTPGQIANLKTFDKVVLATDADRAGDEVAEELRLALVRWCGVERVRFADGMDAAKLPAEELRNHLGLSGHGHREPVPLAP